jgi:hypothetical protein
MRDLQGRREDEETRRVRRLIEEMDDMVDPSGGGLISSVEYCLATDGFHVEARTSECAACEDSSLRLKELEVKKLELELEKLKCEVALCEKDLASKGDNEGRRGGRT